MTRQNNTNTYMLVQLHNMYLNDIIVNKYLNIYFNQLDYLKSEIQYSVINDLAKLLLEAT